jgi:hypothetical protein
LELLIETKMMSSRKAGNRNERQLCIAVDFDGVLAEYDGWKGPQAFGDPRKDVVTVLHILRADGWRIVIHTTRSPQQIAKYLLRHAIPYDEINRNSHYQNAGSKPVATVYWDDRAICYSGDAYKDIEKIRKFRTWSGRR